MKYESIQRAQAEVSKNEFVSVALKPKRRHKLDIWDMLVVPLVIGVAVSIGFLIFNIVKAAGLPVGIETLNSLLCVMR